MTVSGDKVSLIVQVSLRQIVFLIEEIVSCGGDIFPRDDEVVNKDGSLYVIIINNKKKYLIKQ